MLSRARPYPKRLGCPQEIIISKNRDLSGTVPEVRYELVVPGAAAAGQAEVIYKFTRSIKVKN